MFDGYKNEFELPTEGDVGKYISQSDIEKWWKQLQTKFPKIYRHEPCPQQFPTGTKLMCYEDDNPEKPVRIEIVGSRWRQDPLMGKQAMYVVRQDGALKETELSSCHEEDPNIGWCLGWNAVCPVYERNVDEEKERADHFD